MPLDAGQPDIAAVVDQIVQLHRIRKFCVVSKERCNRSIESLIASVLGYSNDHAETTRKALFRQASEIRKAVEKGGEGRLPHDNQIRAALSAIIPLIIQSAASRAPWDERLKAAEKSMQALAAMLPTADWAQSVRGFGLLNLAIIQGEAGIPIGEYRSVSGLWKRLGLAVINGERQQRKSGKEAAAAHAYSPTHRSQIYVVGSVSVFMGQKPGMPYRDAYDHRRSQTEPRIDATADLPKGDPGKWTKGRCDNDARRVMTKALVRDMWRVSRGLPPRGANHAA